jgi:hypothetical protein
MLPANLYIRARASQSMNTPAHLIAGLAAFGKPETPGQSKYVIAGALAPDLSLYVMTFWSIWVMGIQPQTVFDELYYSLAWQRVFAIDNSFVLWSIMLAFALWAGRAGATAFACAALLHIALDFPVHNHDARMHFWPVSDWVFVSPFSYWDSAYHAGIVGGLEMSMCLLLGAVLMMRYRQLLQRAGTAILVLAEMAAGGAFRILF